VYPTLHVAEHVSPATLPTHAVLSTPIPKGRDSSEHARKVHSGWTPCNSPTTEFPLAAHMKTAPFGAKPKSVRHVTSQGSPTTLPWQSDMSCDSVTVPVHSIREQLTAAWAGSRVPSAQRYAAAAPAKPSLQCAMHVSPLTVPVQSAPST